MGYIDDCTTETVDGIAWNPAGIEIGRFGHLERKCVEGPQLGHREDCFRAQFDSE